MSDSKPNIDLKMRPAVPDDQAFVFNAWLKSYAGSDWARAIRPQTFFKEHHRAIEDVLSRSRVTVACLASDPDTIFGFVVVEPTPSGPVVHYVYVKHTYRRLGVARRLLSSLADEDVVYTHRPPQDALAKAVPPAWSHNPYLFLRSA